MQFLFPFLTAMDGSRSELCSAGNAVLTNKGLGSGSIPDCSLWASVGAESND